MKILIVGLVENEQAERVWQEGYKRSHNVVGCYTTELTIRSGTKRFEPSLRGKSLKDFDLIYLWTLGDRRWEWYSVCRYLHDKYGTIIVDKDAISSQVPAALVPTVSFQKLSQAAIPFPKSTVIFSDKSVDFALKDFKPPYVVKLGKYTLHQGKGVFKAENAVEVEKIITKHTKANPSFIVREFIPNDGDIRIFTIGYKAIAAMRRIPKKGDFRSNISRGAKGEIFDLESNPDVTSLAEDAAKVTHTQIAGVDIVINKNTGKKYVLEVNNGPQFMGIEKYTKANIALEIIKYFEKLYNTSKH